MADHGSGSSDHLDPSVKPAVGVATPHWPGKTASPSPLSPGSSPEAAPAPPGASPPAIPDHELLQCIGRGSYGEVWLARDVLGQYRAVKVIHRFRFEADHAYEREFEGLKRYEPVSRGDPSQVAVLHVGRHDDAGFYYYVMELADDANAECGMQNAELAAGTPASTPRSSPFTPVSYTPRTLKSELIQRKRLPLEECVEIGLALTTALEHLHGHGLIHRDIKPANVIFIHGVPKLADIGLVAALDATMSFVGTAGYVPPEGPGKPTGDIYSLGKVLYEISVGRDTSEFPELPTAWESFAEQKQQLEFNAVVLRACAHDPGQRYRTAQEMHEDLVLLQRGKSVRHRQRVQRRWAVGRRVALTTLGMLVLLLSAYVLYRTFLGPREMVPASAEHPVAVPLRASVFVLPFRNEVTNRVPNDLRGRITDAFIDSLALIEGVRRSPRKSGWVHQDEDILRRSLAETNDMRHILTGRISGSGDTLTLTLCLLARGENQPVWTESFSGTTNEVIALERRALAKMASALGLKITGTERQKIDQLLANNLEALGWMRQAWGVFQHKAGTQSGFKNVRELAQKAILLDSRYVDADFFDAYIVRNLFVDRAPSDVWPDVQRRMLNIEQRDDTFGQALDQLGGYLLIYQRDWIGAYRVWNRGLLYCSEQERHFRQAFYYRTHGWFDEARIHQELSEQSKPAFIEIQLFSASSRWVERRYAEGAAAARKTLELYPGQPLGYQVLAHCLVGNGEYDAGIQATHKAQEVWKKQEMTALRAVAYAKWGQPEKARETLQELLAVERTGPYLQPYYVARVYSALNEKAIALDWLEKADQDKSEYLFMGDFGGGLRTDPAWDDFQDEPRFQALLKKVGLDQWPRPKPKLEPGPGF